MQYAGHFSVKPVVGIQDRIADGAFDSVTRAYGEATGKRFFRVKRTVAAEATCKEFHRLQFLFGCSTSAVMAEALALYGPEWCMETFKTKFPPFFVVIGERCRKRLIQNHRPKVAQSAESLVLQAKDVARNLVSLMGYDGALALVTEGWPVDERLRAAVFHELRRAKNG